MKNRVLAAVAFLFFIFGVVSARAADPDPAKWPDCKPGGKPMAAGEGPKGVTVFRSDERGPVLMSEAGPNLVNCNLPLGTPLYWGSDGTLRDVASNQVLWTVGKWQISRTVPTPANATQPPIIVNVPGQPITINVPVTIDMKQVQEAAKVAPPPPPVVTTPADDNDAGWCGIASNTTCTVGALIIAAGGYALLHHGGSSEQVHTDKPTARKPGVVALSLNLQPHQRSIGALVSINQMMRR